MQKHDIVAVVWEWVWHKGALSTVDSSALCYLTRGDMAVLKLDKQGNLIWVKTWGTEGFDAADGQIVVDEDTIYVCGRVNATDMFSGGDAVIVKFSKESGDYLAHTTWGGAAFDDGLGMTSDGAYLYVVGLTLSLDYSGEYSPLVTNFRTWPSPVS